ncbi:MAG: HAD family phosphatase [Bacteroidales bacterium]|jgi:beta-phosphoglucomutase-like phosphatase (HAD superfamily)|nr:HAD family phosphatase [Bacteroidales bacterium]
MNLVDVTAFLFDFDGVIADTENGRYDEYRIILAEYGYDLPSRCLVEDLVGLTGDGFIGKFFPEIPSEQAKEIVRRRQTYYLEHLDRFCRPFPGMRQTVRDIKEQGYFLALTTANPLASAQQLVRVVGVAEYFDVICGREICENPLTKVKDYSRVPQHIHKTIGECVVIEDSPVGVAGAKRSGFRCIAFEHFKDQFSGGAADCIIHDYNDLRAIVGLPSIHLNGI